MSLSRAHLRLLAVLALWCASCLAPAGLELRICGCGSWLATWLRASSADCAQQWVELAAESEPAGCCERADSPTRVPTAKRAAPDERSGAAHGDRAHCDPAHESCACLRIETSSAPACAQSLAGRAEAQRSLVLASERPRLECEAPVLAPRRVLVARTSGRPPPGERAHLPLRI